MSLYDFIRIALNIPTPELETAHLKVIDHHGVTLLEDTMIAEVAGAVVLTDADGFPIEDSSYLLHGMLKGWYVPILLEDETHDMVSEE